MTEPDERRPTYHDYDDDRPSIRKKRRHRSRSRSRDRGRERERDRRRSRSRSRSRGRGRDGGYDDDAARLQALAASHLEQQQQQQQQQQGVLPGLAIPGLPSLPGIPGLPGLPGALPGLPALPGAPPGLGGGGFGLVTPEATSALVAAAAAAAAKAAAAVTAAPLGGLLPTVGGGAAAAAAAVAAAAGATAVPVLTGAAYEAAAKKAREVFIGNLAVGQTTIEVLTELFNAALAPLVPDPVTNPPVTGCRLDPAGRFGFIELRTEELATTALNLHGTEVYGRALNIGRPKGYVPGFTAQQPGGGGAAAAAGGAAPALANGSAAAGGAAAAAAAGADGAAATPVLLLEGLLDAAAIRAADERLEVSEMVYEEARRCGAVQGLAVPVPPPDVPADAPCRVYVRFGAADEARRCREMMHGRLFDDRTVAASYSTEADFARAAAGQWVVAPGVIIAGGAAGPPLAAAPAAAPMAFPPPPP